MRTFLILLFSFLFIHCNNDDDGHQALPPATQTGEGTFACYVDGKAFIDTSGGWFNCFYQYVGGYYFSIGGQDEEKAPWAIMIQTNDKTISQGEILPLKSDTRGNAFATGLFYTSNTGGDYSLTNNEYTGELHITKLDFENHIVSGTFWFDIPHPITGDTVKIREGRFDTRFTQ